MPLISAPSMAGETITVATMRTRAYSVKVGGAVSLNSCILVCMSMMWLVQARAHHSWFKLELITLGSS